MAEIAPKSPGSMISFLNEHPELAESNTSEANAAYEASIGEYQAALSEFYGINISELHDRGLELGRVVLTSEGKKVA